LGGPTELSSRGGDQGESVMRRLAAMVVVAAAVTGFWATPARAWHQRGHMLTALVAYDRLPEARRAELVAILREHPRYKEDFESAMPDGYDREDQDRWLFAHASIWPDLVRKQGGDGSIPADPKKKTSYHRANWHFVNYPLVLVPTNTSAATLDALKAAAAADVNVVEDPPAEESPDMNVLQAIAFNSKILRDESRSKGDRAVALCWVLHLVGDVHQPLHATALFTKRLFEPKAGPAHGGDHGGNLIKFGSTSDDNLHSLWDDGPGSSSTFTSVDARAQVMLEDDAFQQAGTAALAKTTPEQWAKESFERAGDFVYTKDIRKRILLAEKHGETSAADDLVELPEDYRPAVRKLSEKRVVEGGYRLAEFLK
jgi:hypothetical protein